MKSLTKLPNTQFSGLDFDNVMRDIYALVQDNPDYNENWEDFLSSSAGRMMVELFAYIADQLAARIDWNVNENFLTTATQNRSILRLLKLIDYKLELPSSSKVVTTIELSTATTEKFILTPEYNKDGDAPGVRNDIYSINIADKKGIVRNYEALAYDEINKKFLYKHEVSINSNASYPAASFDVNFFEGTTKVEQFIATTSDNPKFTLSNYPVINNSVVVYLKTQSEEIELLQTYNFFSREAQDLETEIPYVLNIGVDGSVEIEFASSRLIENPDKLLSVGDTLYVFYRIGGGVLGNLPIKYINFVSNLISYPDENIYEANFINYEGGSGGTDIETIDHAIYKGPLSLRSVEKAVTAEDYHDIFSRNTSILKSVSYGASNTPINFYSKYGLNINPQEVWSFVLLNKSYDGIPPSQYNNYQSMTVRLENRFNEKYSFNNSSFNQQASFTSDPIRLGSNISYKTNTAPRDFQNYVVLSTPADFKEKIGYIDDNGDLNFNENFSFKVSKNRTEEIFFNSITDNFIDSAVSTFGMINGSLVDYAEEDTNAVFYSPVYVTNSSSDLTNVRGFDITSKYSIGLNIDNRGMIIVNLKDDYGPNDNKYIYLSNVASVKPSYYNTVYEARYHDGIVQKINDYLENSILYGKAREIETFTVSVGASSTSTLSIAGRTDISVTAGMTAGQVASAIASYDFVDWNVSSEGEVVTFTARVGGETSQIIFNAGATGVDGTIAVVQEGRNHALPSQYLGLNLPSNTTEIPSLPGAGDIPIKINDSVYNISYGGTGITGVDGSITVTTPGSDAITAEYTITADTIPATEGNITIAGTDVPIKKKEVEVLTITSGSTDAGDIIIGGQTFTLTAGLTAIQVASAIAGGTFTDWDALQGTAPDDNTVTFTAKVAGIIDDLILNTGNTGVNGSVEVTVEGVNCSSITELATQITTYINNDILSLWNAEQVIGAEYTITLTAKLAGAISAPTFTDDDGTGAILLITEDQVGVDAVFEEALFAITNGASLKSGQITIAGTSVNVVFEDSAAQVATKIVNAISSQSLSDWDAVIGLNPNEVVLTAKDAGDIEDPTFTDDSRTSQKYIDMVRYINTDLSSPTNTGFSCSLVELENNTFDILFTSNIDDYISVEKVSENATNDMLYYLYASATQEPLTASPGGDYSAVASEIYDASGYRHLKIISPNTGLGSSIQFIAADFQTSISNSIEFMDTLGVRFSSTLGETGNTSTKAIGKKTLTYVTNFNSTNFGNFLYEVNYLGYPVEDGFEENRYAYVHYIGTSESSIILGSVYENFYATDRDTYRTQNKAKYVYDTVFGGDGNPSLEETDLVVKFTNAPSYTNSIWSLENSTNKIYMFPYDFIRLETIDLSVISSSYFGPNDRLSFSIDGGARVTIDLDPISSYTDFLNALRVGFSTAGGYLDYQNYIETDFDNRFILYFKNRERSINGGITFYSDIVQNLGFYKIFGNPGESGLSYVYLPIEDPISNHPLGSEFVEIANHPYIYCWDGVQGAVVGVNDHKVTFTAYAYGAMPEPTFTDLGDTGVEGTFALITPGSISAHEVREFTVTHGATVSGNIEVAHTILAVAAGDTAAQVAGKIAAAVHLNVPTTVFSDITFDCRIQDESYTGLYRTPDFYYTYDNTERHYIMNKVLGNRIPDTEFYIHFINDKRYSRISGTLGQYNTNVDIEGGLSEEELILNYIDKYKMSCIENKILPAKFTTFDVKASIYYYINYSPEAIKYNLENYIREKYSLTNMDFNEPIVKSILFSDIQNFDGVAYAEIEFLGTDYLDPTTNVTSKLETDFDTIGVVSEDIYNIGGTKIHGLIFTYIPKS
jgi:hypothetical protein